MVTENANSEQRQSIPRFDYLFIGAIILLLIFSIISIFTPKKDSASKEKKIEQSTNSDEKTQESISTNRVLVKADNFRYNSEKYWGFKFNSKLHQIDFLFKGDDQIRIRTLKNAVFELSKKEKKTLFVTNAGIFNPNYYPVGLFIQDGTLITPLNTENGSGNFYLKPNGVFYINKDKTVGVKETLAFKKEKIEPQFATQSGPLLLVGNKVHEAFNQGSPNLRVRSGVGIISPYEAVFLISKEPVSFYDFAMTFKNEFGCRDALYLDGVISEAFIPTLQETGLSNEFAGIIAISE